MPATEVKALQAVETQSATGEAPPVKQFKIQTVEDLHTETAKELQEKKDQIKAQKIEDNVITSTAQTFTLDPNADFDDGSKQETQLEEAQAKKDDEADQADYSFTQLDGKFNNLP